MRGNPYAMRFNVFLFRFTQEVHMRQERLPVTGSNFFGTKSTRAAHGDREGTIHPFARKLSIHLRISDSFSSKEFRWASVRLRVEVRDFTAFNGATILSDTLRRQPSRNFRNEHICKIS
jgi:hypothetical protein